MLYIGHSLMYMIIDPLKYFIQRIQMNLYNFYTKTLIQAWQFSSQFFLLRKCLNLKLVTKVTYLLKNLKKKIQENEK